MNAFLFWAVAVCGGLGAATRFSIDSAVINRVRLAFPWVTFSINVTGSFALGLLTAWLTGALAAPEWVLLLGAGFLGGYTTFSTTSYDTIRLLNERRYIASLLNLFGTLLAGVAAAALGLWCGSLL
ncbi:fluoride efflux transporter CrcB [Arthrobacter sp. N199823]|uniref:fluoride efflux transporter CrcB n=1 Tax=Arthrobacter sp. N199823 TaxID=2058895 RepID=UPI000CE41C75|nr:fluoride efflux transporter CrcB [Arthrobacter sp. N199823]